jgi:hypothetical protein
MTEKLQPFDDQHTDFAAVIDDLVRRAWISLDDDRTLKLTRTAVKGWNGRECEVKPATRRH